MDNLNSLKKDIQKIEDQKVLELMEQEIRQWTSTHVGRRSFLASVPILLASCATGEKHRHREGDNQGQETQITVADEIKMTQEYLPQMRKEYPSYKDARVQSYITELGNKIAVNNKLEGNPYNYRFTVCDSEQVNAFALPAGTVFVTKALIQNCQSEAELAGVVGHEIGHIQARHTAERLDKQRQDQKKSLIYGIGGAILGGAAGIGLGNVLCKKEDRECRQRVALYGAAAGAGGGLLIQKFAFMANSREDEMEADRIGFRTSYNAGFHKDHIGLFYNRLLEMEKQYKKNQSPLLAPLTDAMSTHPPSQERVNQMNQMANQNPKKGDIISRPDFLAIKKILT